MKKNKWCYYFEIVNKLPSITHDTSDFGLDGPATHVSVIVSPILPCFGPNISTFVGGTKIKQKIKIKIKNAKNIILKKTN